MTNRDAAIEAACRAHAPHWDQIDEDIRAYARDQMHAAIAAYEQERAKDGPVAWRCKDYGDAWIYYRTLAAAEEYQHEYGCLMEPVYLHPSPAADVKALRDLLVEIRKWMDGEAMGQWDAKFIAKIDAALATSGGGE